MLLCKAMENMAKAVRNWFLQLPGTDSPPVLKRCVIRRAMSTAEHSAYERKDQRDNDFLVDGGIARILRPDKKLTLSVAK